MFTVDPQAIAAEEKLERDLTTIFSKMRVVPDNIVASIDSWGIAEDGKTFLLMCGTTDGSTLIISVCPGERLAVSLES